MTIFRSRLANILSPKKRQNTGRILALGFHFGSQSAVELEFRPAMCVVLGGGREDDAVIANAAAESRSSSAFES